MVDGESPRTHLRGKRPIKLSDLACIRIESEKGKRGIVLAEGEVNGIPLSCLSRADESAPTDAFSHWYAQVSLSERVL
jgi:hypothetical protein